MKIIIFILFCVLLLNGASPAEDKIIFKDGVNFEQKLSDNDVFFKNCVDFEILPLNNLGYFLDEEYGMIFKVELSSGKLLKTISSRGQGPGELHLPASLRVKNNMIFVLDNGFNGIQIFDQEGKFINSFRIRSTFFGDRNLYVNEKNEIFVGKINTLANTMVAVYDLQGKELESLIQYQKDGKKDNTRESLMRKAFLISLDSKGNIYILYYILRKLSKYTRKGEMLWETEIKNEILDKFSADDYFNIDKKKYTMRQSVFSLDITSRDEIVVGHAGGGCVFTSEGKMKKLILLNERIGDNNEYHFLNLHTFKIRGNMLMNLSVFGKIIYQYQYKEDFK